MLHPELPELPQCSMFVLKAWLRVTNLFRKKTSARSGIAGQSLKSVATILIWIPVCILLNQASAKHISNQFNKNKMMQNCEMLHASGFQATDGYGQPLRGSRLRQRRRRLGPSLQGSSLCFPPLILPLYGNSVPTIYFLNCAETAEHVHRIW